MAGWQICVLVVIGYLAVFHVTGILGIYCFQCNSLHDPECEIIMPNDTTSVFYRPCQPTEESGNQEMFCRKVVQTIYDRDGMVRVIRGCGWVQHHRDCYVISNKGHQEIACQCFHDACNSAERSYKSSVLFAFALIPFINYIMI